MSKGLERGPEAKSSRKVDTGGRVIETGSVNPENYDEVLKWIKEEMKSFIDGRDFTMKHQLLDKFVEIVESLAEKLNITVEGLDIYAIVKCDEKITYPPDDDSPDSGVIEGTLSLMGERFFIYSSDTNGDGFSIDVSSQGAKAAVPKLIQSLREQSK